MKPLVVLNKSKDWKSLKQADVSRDQAAEILGHDRGKDVTYGRYGKPAEAKRGLEVIKKLEFSLDLG